MQQVGDEMTFALSTVPPPESGVYAYVWEYSWDKTVQVTLVPTTTKVLNMGGDPNNGRKLFYTVRPVLTDGQSVALQAEVVVNNPPQVFPSPTVSANDQFFPYATEITVIAFDFEGDPLTFHYYDSVGASLGTGTTAPFGPVEGTWGGVNGVVGVYASFRNIFNTTIQSDTTIRLEITDNQGGQTNVYFQFFGRTGTGPVLGVTADPDILTGDATSLPDQRIGPGQTVTFTVYATDPQSNHFDFLWSFFGSFGWTLPNDFQPGVSTVQPDGSVRNSYTKDISGQMGGLKRVLIRVTNIDTGKYTEQPVVVRLLDNGVAATGLITIRDQVGAEIAEEEVPAGTRLRFAATVDDPEGDVVNYQWHFVQPAAVAPLDLRLWGRSVILDTTGYPVGSQVRASLLAYDRMLGVTSVEVPVLTIIPAV